MRHTYWITLSAWKRSAGGIVTPSAFAVLRLMTSSNFTGPFHRQVGGLCTFEDFVHVDGGAPIAVGHVWPIRHEAANVGKLPRIEHRRQVVLGGKCYYPCTVIPQHSVPQRDEGISPLPGHDSENAV